MTLTRSFLFLLTAFVAVGPACILRRENLRGPEGDDAGFDARVSDDDARIDVGRPMLDDAGRDAFVEPGEDAPPPDAFVCGAPGQACCGGACEGDWVDCVRGTCLLCGSSGAACCASGPSCMGSDGCLDGQCQACGRTGERCCDGDRCTDSAASCRGGQCLGTVPTDCNAAGASCCGDFVRYCTGRFVCGGSSCIACGGAGQPCCFETQLCDTGLNCMREGVLNYRCR